MVSPANTSPKFPPIWLTWMLITSVGAAIFGALTTLVDGEPQGLFLTVFIGGLIIGGLEWRSFRHYRVPVSFAWCAAKGIMMLLLFGVFMAGLVLSAENETYVLLPVCGFFLDGARGWLLRSHFLKIKPWLIGCALGWLVELGLLAGVGIVTMDIFDSNHTLFFTINGAANGLWMGLCRGISLSMMLRDRHRRRSSNTSSETP